MKQRIALEFLATVSVAMVVCLLAATPASAANSGWNRFLTWDYAGVHHCADQWSSIVNVGGVPPKLLGQEGVMYRSGSDCHLDAVPAGWLATRGYIVKENGVQCWSTNGWQPNTYSTAEWYGYGVLCNIEGSHSYRFVGMAEVYRPNFGGFTESNWLSSPWITP